MSFKVIMIGFMGMFATFILFAMVMLNMIPPQIYIYGMTGIGIIFGMTLAVIAILLNGVMGPFMTAKTSGKLLIGMITNSKNLKLLPGRDSGGLSETKIGQIMTPPKSIINWPNGVKGGIGYFRYASTMEPKLVKAFSKLKENGITDIEELEAVASQVRKKGQDLVINLE